MRVIYQLNFVIISSLIYFFSSVYDHVIWMDLLQLLTVGVQQNLSEKLALELFY